MPAILTREQKRRSSHSPSGVGRRADRLPDRRSRILGLPLGVSPAVLIPRARNRVARRVGAHRGCRSTRNATLDLGTGSGAIAPAVAHERPRAKIPRNRHVDRGARSRVKCAAPWDFHVEFARSDWYDGLPDAWRRIAFGLDREQSAVRRDARSALGRR
jgi:hypothetical protein